MAETYKVTLPTSQYYTDEVECRTGCPVNTDARGYLMAVSAGDTLNGYAISRATNPFASICGKVCGAPCEKACRRSEVDEALSIRNMKGYLTARHGPETGDLDTPLTHARVRGSVTPHLNGKSVGIIGGGVAGYTCAHDLARLGYACTIYEKYETSGGQLVQGVPINRLNRQVVQAEIDSILQFKHITIRHGCDVGRDMTFAEIKKTHDAVYIAVGLSAGRLIPMPNSDHANVHIGLAFLLDFNMLERWDLSQQRCIVIGGGDVAFDVARCAVRCQASEVQLCCLEREHLGEMPGSADEREGGRREGVVINDGWGPDEIVVENGEFKGLKIKKVRSVFSPDGRFAPEFEDETRFIAGDHLFMAVGQQAVLDFLDGSGVDLTPQGIIKVDPQTYATNVPGIYAGGDVALGPKLFIDGIASASDAALAIDAYLSGEARQKKRRVLSFTEIENYERREDYLLVDRRDRREEEIDAAREPERNSTCEYSDSEAKDQADRCLQCHIHPTFEGNICILCGGCVDVCPSYCLSMKSIDRIEGDDPVHALVEKEFGTRTVAGDTGSVMLFDPLKCIRCGMCAIKCPTGACKMSENSCEDTYTKAQP